MNAKPPLHILFTMNCEPMAHRFAPDGPKSRDLGGRSIEGFCSRLLTAGYAVTLFVSAGCAEEYAPLLEELAERGVELALHVHPPSLTDGRYNRNLGEYTPEDQRELVELGLDRVEEAVGRQPRSFRPGKFSASDATFRVLYELGFRQGSVSSPGHNVPRDAAVWTGAEEDAHYVDPSNRLLHGTLPFLEIPITTNPTQVGRGGFADDLCLESPSCEEAHDAIIQRQLQRMADNDVAFRTLCLFTRNVFAYHLADDRQSTTLEILIDYFDALREHYDVVPTTLAGAHEHFRRLT